jgi:hypothetical protein
MHQDRIGQIPILGFYILEADSSLHRFSVNLLRGVEIPEDLTPLHRAGASARHLVVDRHVVAGTDRVAADGGLLRLKREMAPVKVTNYGVCRGKRTARMEDIDIFPARLVLQMLWNGEIIR